MGQLKLRPLPFPYTAVGKSFISINDPNKTVYKILDIESFDICNSTQLEFFVTYTHEEGHVGFTYIPVNTFLEYYEKIPDTI